MSYRWRKIGGEWESFNWWTFCIAMVVAYGVCFLGWILISFLVTGRWNHRLLEGAVVNFGSLVVTLIWWRMRSTESPDFEAERKEALRGKQESAIDVIDLSSVCDIASSMSSTVFSVIEFLHVYDERGGNARLPWFTLWLYPGLSTDDHELDENEFEAFDEDWLKKYAIPLEGKWYESKNATAAANRVAVALRYAGYETEIEFLVDD